MIMRNPTWRLELTSALSFARIVVLILALIPAAATRAAEVFRAPGLGHEPFTFLAYGDNRSDAAAHQSVVDRMTAVSPRPGFLINTGDLTGNGSASAYRTFFRIEQALLRDVLLFPCLGNHDRDNLTNFFANFPLLGGARWYTVRSGNTVVHCLDNYSSYSPGSAQYTWFVNELETDSSDVSVRHIVVALHEPPYTTNSKHDSNLDVRRFLCPLFERFGVQVVFLGHVHCYEHSLVNGVHYIITGGGGAPLYDTWGPPDPWTVYREATYEFVRVDVRGDSLIARGIKPNGAVFDSFAVVTP
jgi:acid phosphatase type 7